MRITKALGSTDTCLFPPWTALVCLLFLTLLVGACGKRASQAEAENAADSLAVSTDDAPADSLVAGEDAEADSTAGEEEGKGGFFARFFNKKDDKENEDKEEPVPVELAAVEVQDVPLFLSSTATLEAEKRADILAKIGGEILEILVEEGDEVRRGQVLATLDGAVQRVALEEAEARAGALEQDLERITSLHQQGLASEKQLHDARFLFEEAEARRKAFRLQVDYTEVKAPFSGQVCDRLVDPGQTVAVGVQLFSIVDLDPLLARIHLPEKQVTRIAARQKVTVSPDADPSIRLLGEVLRVAPNVDPRTGTVKTTCQIAKGALALRPGSFVRVKIQTDVHPDVLVIPKRALVPEGGETYVFKVEADSVIKIPVLTGYTNDIVVEITRGLVEGERVVTVGQGGLKTGSRFREITDPEDSVAVAAAPEGSAP